MDDDPPPGVEFLDEWDSPRTPRPPRGGRGRILVLSAVLLVAAVVVAVSLGAAQRRAVGPVTSMSPTPSATPAPTASMTEQTTDQVTPQATTAYTSVVVFETTGPPPTPDPLPSDVEADPLTIKILDKTPKVSGDAIAYRVSVCANSVALSGGKVSILRDNWAIGTFEGQSGPAAGFVPLEPAFPATGMYAKGQCASGYVTFSIGSETPMYLSYADSRFQWIWRMV